MTISLWWIVTSKKEKMTKCNICLLKTQKITMRVVSNVECLSLAVLWILIPRCSMLFRITGRSIMGDSLSKITISVLTRTFSLVGKFVSFRRCTKISVWEKVLGWISTPAESWARSWRGAFWSISTFCPR
jgi:hypothetical protein